MTNGKKKKSILGRILLSVILVFAVIFAVMEVAWRHRSDPADVIRYRTYNPHTALIMPMISAHRAGAGIAPEETMMAFRTCAEDPDFDVDYYEFDLHITKDNVLVLLHDDELDRTSDCREVFGKEHCAPQDYTFEELRTLNMGASFVDRDGKMPYKGLKGEEVPEDVKILDLDTVLDYLESTGPNRYIIEIKNDGELGKRAMDILYRSLEDRKMTDRAVFGSFKGDISDYKDKAYPSFVRGPYLKEVIEFYFSSLFNRKNYHPKFQVLQLPFGDRLYAGNFNLGTAHLINYAHAHDLAVQYWTVNSAEDAEYLMSIGADCITTDDPDMVYEIREKMFGDSY